MWLGPKCNHKCPYKWEAERDLTQKKITEARCYTAGFQDEGMGHKPKDAGNAALEARKG